jgi:hypothetical protein
MEYADSKEDPIMQTVRTHQHNKTQTQQYYRQLETSRQNYKEEKQK